MNAAEAEQAKEVIATLADAATTLQGQVKLYKNALDQSMDRLEELNINRQHLETKVVEAEAEVQAERNAREEAGTRLQATLEQLKQLRVNGPAEAAESERIKQHIHEPKPGSIVVAKGRKKCDAAECKEPGCGKLQKVSAIQVSFRTLCRLTFCIGLFYFLTVPLWQMVAWYLHLHPQEERQLQPLKYRKSCRNFLRAPCEGFTP